MCRRVFLRCQWRVQPCLSSSSPRPRALRSNFDNGDYYMGIMVVGWLLSMAFIVIYVLFYAAVVEGLPFNYYILVCCGVVAGGGAAAKRRRVGCLPNRQQGHNAHRLAAILHARRSCPSPRRGPSCRSWRARSLPTTLPTPMTVRVLPTRNGGVPGKRTATPLLTRALCFSCYNSPRPGH